MSAFLQEVTKRQPYEKRESEAISGVSNVYASAKPDISLCSTQTTSSDDMISVGRDFGTSRSPLGAVIPPKIDSNNFVTRKLNFRHELSCEKGRGDGCLGKSLYLPSVYALDFRTADTRGVK